MPAISEAYTIPQGSYAGTFPGDPTTGPFAVKAQLTYDMGLSGVTGLTVEDGSLTTLGQSTCIVSQSAEQTTFNIIGDSFEASTTDVSVSGTFNTAGTMLTVTSFKFLSGDCQTAPAGTITLTQQ